MGLTTRSRAAKNNVEIFILFTTLPHNCLTRARWKKFPQENVFEKSSPRDFSEENHLQLREG
jgi:hypothetical protein